MSHIYFFKQLLPSGLTKLEWPCLACSRYSRRSSPIWKQSVGIGGGITRALSHSHRNTVLTCISFFNIESTQHKFLKGPLWQVLPRLRPIFKRWRIWGRWWPVLEQNVVSRWSFHLLVTTPYNIWTIIASMKKKHCSNRRQWRASLWEIRGGCHKSCHSLLRRAQQNQRRSEDILCPTESAAPYNYIF